MNKVFSKFKLFIPIVLGMMVFGACSMYDLDINKDPNNPTTVNPRLLLSNAQIDCAQAFEGINSDCQDFVGVTASQGTDAFSLTNTSYNGLWSSFYSDGMKDLESILTLTAGDVQQKNMRGVAQAMKAFYMGAFVDLFGSVPYSEAFKGDAATANSQAKFDTDKDIYADLINLCDSAVANLAKASFVPITNDIMYGNSIAKWTKFAKTTKLKLIFNSRRVRSTSTAELTSIFATPADIIYGTTADNFSWNYTTTATPLDRRHPWHRNGYTGANNEFTYFNQEWIVDMVDYADPRLYYYTFPQIDYALNPADPTQRGAIPFAYTPYNQQVIKRLYTNKGVTVNDSINAFLSRLFVRVRGDLSGIPQDGQYRLTAGAYPADGLHWSKGPVQLGTDYSGAAGGGRTGRGAGVFPLLTGNHVKFWHIEAILANGVPGDARKLFEEAMRDNFKLISDFSLAKGTTTTAMPQAAIDKYVTLFLARYDAAGTNEQKLNVVLKQARYANFGNGMEMYNAFRRTGYPNDLTAPKTRIRQFPLRLPYSADELSLNKNAPKGDAVIFDRDAIFWDVVKFKF
jgi:hypothetical protein